MKELYLLIEEEELTPQQQADNKVFAGDAWTLNTVSWGTLSTPGSGLCSVGGIVGCAGHVLKSHG